MKYPRRYVKHILAQVSTSDECVEPLSNRRATNRRSPDAIGPALTDGPYLAEEGEHPRPHQEGTVPAHSWAYISRLNWGDLSPIFLLLWKDWRALQFGNLPEKQAYLLYY